MPESGQMFVSYSDTDQAIAHVVVDRLTQAGVPVWTDSAIRLGEDFVEAIERGLRSSDVYLLLISPQFMSSEFCLYELGFALKGQRAGATIIPVAISGTDVRVLPPYLRRFHAIDAGGLAPEQIAGKVLDRLSNPQGPTARQHVAA
jgi:hypothetical protein